MGQGQCVDAPRLSVPGQRTLAGDAERTLCLVRRNAVQAQQEARQGSKGRTMIRVYTASKLTTEPLWRDLDAKLPFIFLHARWLKHNIIDTPDTPEHAAQFWLENEEDVRNADVV